MSKRTIIIVGIVAVLVGIAVAAPKIMLFIAGNKSVLNTEERTFFIREKISLKDIATQLKQQKIIEDTKDFI